MISDFPIEIFGQIAKTLSQEDKISLCYVSKNVQKKIQPSLYENLFLNEKPYFPSDLDPSLGTHSWSVIYYKSRYDVSKNSLISKQKLQCLVRTLNEKPFEICPLIRKVHCSWHLDEDLLIQLIKLLMRYAVNLQYFSNFLEDHVSRLLLPRASQLQSIDIVPPTRIPTETADNIYYANLEVLLTHYKWDNINELTLHVNACTFFPHINKPLKIRSLCLNLRPDTYSGTFFEQPYYEIFDTNTLKELEILSWYRADESSTNLYNKWNLHQLWKFRNIRSLTLLSLAANEPFLKICFQHFKKLERIKIDNIFDVPLSYNSIEVLVNSVAAKTIKYIDIKFKPLQSTMVSFERDAGASIKLKLNQNCQCNNCKETFNDVIIGKIFPATEAPYSNRYLTNESTGLYYQEIFKFNSLLPYTHFVDQTPAIGYDCSSVEKYAENINRFFGRIRRKTMKPVTPDDIIRLYHAHIHSLKKTYDFFINRFPNLEFLTLNDLSTRVVQVDELQSCNVPIFFSEGYVSNQIYELVTDESLFD